MSKSKKTVAKKAHNTITTDGEFIFDFRGGKEEYFLCPKDFLQYFIVFLQHKIKETNDFKKEAEQYKSSDEFKKKDKEKQLEELNCLDVLITRQSQAYLLDLDEHPDDNTLKLKADDVLYSLALQDNNPRLLFFELFEHVMWQFMQYLSEQGLRALIKEEMNSKKSTACEFIKIKLAELVRNTVYTNKNIKVPQNINIEICENIKPKKLKRKDYIYGSLFIQAAKLYGPVRNIWLTLCSEHYNAGVIFERAITRAAMLGFKVKELRYYTMYGRGGKKTNLASNSVKNTVRKYYNRLKDMPVSVPKLASDVLNDQKHGYFYSEEYRQIQEQEERTLNEYIEMCEKMGEKPKQKKKVPEPELETVIGWIREWDADNNIDRSKYKRKERTNTKNSGY